MITERYQITDILKQSQQKSIYRVQTFTKENKKNFYIIKKFSHHDKKYFDTELQLYNVVLKDAHLKGFPQLKDVLHQNDGCSIVLAELGDNVETLRKRVGGRFTLKTTLMMGLQLIDRLEYLHSREYIHGDVQPSNFVTGAGKLGHKMYLVDFQFSSPFIVNGSHITEEVVQKFSGSMRYCSLAATDHKNISRKDDMQSFVYSLIFLIKGYLPWFELKSQTLIEAYNETAKMKKQKVNQLLQGLPEAFGSILKYVKELKFNEKPNYERVRNQLLAVMKKNGYDLDYKYDWTYM